MTNNDADPSPLVDIHCHFMPPNVAGRDVYDDDPRWPRLILSESEINGLVMLGDEVFREVTPPTWDMRERISQMDAAGVAIQVISPIPIALTYWAEPKSALEHDSRMNDWLAEQVDESGGRLRGLGTVPLQDPDLAIRELGRLHNELHLSGIEIGTVVDGHELGDAKFRPFFRAASEMGVPIFLHPMARYHGMGHPRCEDALTSNGIDVLTDTSIAVSSLVFGGVLDEFENLRVCLSHGGGTFPWVYPRLLALGGTAINPREEWDRQISRLYVDALVFDPEHLELLKTRFGVDHIIGGTDYPFIAGLVDPGAILEDGFSTGIFNRAEVDRIRFANAFEFLGESLPEM